MTDISTMSVIKKANSPYTYMKKYLEVTQTAGKQFYQNFIDEGKVVMLNLLKFRIVADYTDLEQLKPEQTISGKAAYQLYMDYTLPELKKAGSRILFYGEAKHFLIGPEREQWDAVLLVEHQSVLKFLAFAENEDYLKTAGHRTAALEDSRLLPIKEKGI